MGHGPLAGYLKLDEDWQADSPCVVGKGLVIDLMTGFRIVGGLRGIRKLSVYQPRAPEVLLYRPILR